MIIHEPEMREESGEIFFSARVEFAQPIPDVPKRLWYHFPAEYAPHLTDGSEPFAAALVQLAMYWSEELEIRGRVSPKFAYGLQEYRNVFYGWLPKTFKMIEIDFRQVAAAKNNKGPKVVGQAFSGGVDSMFTLWSNLPQNQPLPEYRVTHGLFIQGFDYELTETAAYRSALQNYTRLFEDLKMTLIPAATNCRDFWRYRLDWEIMHGAPVLGTALALGKLFEKFYSPGGFPYWMNEPAGSTFVIDPMLSTDSIEIIYHGGAFLRYEKMIPIVDWGVTQKYLRVCNRTPKEMNGMNCSRCSKCMQIGTRLHMFGHYPKYKTFKQPFSLLPYFPWMFHTTLSDLTLREVTRQAVDFRRWDIYLIFQASRIFSWIHRKTKKLLRRILSPEAEYRFKKRIYANIPNRTV